VNATLARASRWLPTLLIALALLPLLAKIPAAAGFTGTILAYPFQVDDSEGVILSEAQWLARGVDPYQPARGDFFTAAPYTPIYTLINAAAFAIGPFTFKAGRGVAWLATLAVAALIAGLVWWRTRRPALAAWAGLAILTTNLVSVWSVRARPDHLALAFNLAGFALIWSRWTAITATPTDAQRGRWAIDRATWRTLWLAAICCALGFYTKQTLLAAPVALGLGLLLARPRAGIAFGAIYGALVLMPFALLTAITRGGFYQKIVAFHSSWSWHDFAFLGGPFVTRYWPLLLLGIVLPLAVALAALRGRALFAHLRADRDLLPALYLPSALFFALGAGTHGGNHNHFVESVIVALFCGALLVGRYLDADKRSPWLAWRALAPVPLIVLALALGNEARFGTENWLARDFRQPRPAEREGWQNVASFVTNDPGPVYSDNTGLLLVAGKEVRYTDPFSLTFAARTGQWDESALVGRVERGEFSLIALRYDVFATPANGGGANDLTPALYTAIRTRYRVIERNVMTIYAPR
jgi:4-amino-4-deoxy-L-arabinose transferase-like glycosyltransferase